MYVRVTQGFFCAKSGACIQNGQVRLSGLGTLQGVFYCKSSNFRRAPFLPTRLNVSESPQEVGQLYLSSLKAFFPTGQCQKLKTTVEENIETVA